MKYRELLRIPPCHLQAPPQSQNSRERGWSLLLLSTQGSSKCSRFLSTEILIRVWMPFEGVWWRKSSGIFQRWYKALEKICWNVVKTSYEVPLGQHSLALDQDSSLLNLCSVLCCEIAPNNTPVNKFLVNKNNENIWKTEELLAGYASQRELNTLLSFAFASCY